MQGGTVFDGGCHTAPLSRLAAAIKSCGTQIYAYIVGSHDEPQGASPIQPPALPDQGKWIIDIPTNVNSLAEPSPSSSYPDDSSSGASLLLMKKPMNRNLTSSMHQPSTELPRAHHDDPSRIWHPIIVLFREHELGRHVLVLTVPMIIGLLAVHNSNSSNSSLACLAALALSVGFSATWMGILLRQTFRRTANAIEQLGVASIFVAFYGLVCSLLPPNLARVPGICFCISLIPFLMALFLGTGYGGHGMGVYTY